MATTLAFDIYGTLIDTHGVIQALTVHLGERARAFSVAWRSKQLEYAFRRGLMRSYRTFEVCTREALVHTCSVFGLGLGEGEIEALLAVYRQLPAFPDAAEGLRLAREAGFRLYAFSNGTGEAVEGLLRHAGLRDCFLDVVSVDEVRSFKPDPEVYAHFLRRAGVPAGEAWLVSSNPFDLLGAMAAGLRAAWVRRGAEVFDPWGVAPTLTVGGLTGLAAALGAPAATGRDLS